MTANRNQNFEYHFESLKIETNFWGDKISTDYRETIHRFAADGWRFVQAYAPATGADGRSCYVELIFERPVE
ncbi:MAG: DUF4177 domain-containing protein [Verrucomicrobiales bacterium]|nr:DUF4177 domain-containing protein [Verrucomicrobiales bacterium]